MHHAGSPIALSVFVSAFAATSACATTPGARPTDMSASQHEAAAKGHDDEAAPHAAAYDPKASGAERSCGGARSRVEDGPCWTSNANPTAGHLHDAEAHQKMAADHRAASKALRDAEASACGGVSEADRDESPFVHREDIVSATKIEMTTTSGKSTTVRLVGATVVMRAVPGLTKEYLQRHLDCHLARNAAMGFVMSEMAFCPLSVKGVRVTVEGRGGAFAMEMRADETEAAREIFRRAQALVPGA